MNRIDPYTIKDRFSGLRKAANMWPIITVMILFAFWMRAMGLETVRQQAGWVVFSLGFILLASYLISGFLKEVRLPLISGYIFTGILAGPYICGFLSNEMVEKLHLIDDLALGFIALTAGGELSVSALKKQGKGILLNIVFLTVVVFSLVAVSIVLLSDRVAFFQNLARPEIISMAILLGVIAIARSPSSAIAIINECKASGPFTDTVFGVTVAMDVLIIVIFTLAMAYVENLLSASIPGLGGTTIIAVALEIVISFVIGFFTGRLISIYIEKAGHDLPLYLLFLAFGVVKMSAWLGGYMEMEYGVHLRLEPLLICMSAGFTVRNIGNSGKIFTETLERTSLPIYVLFFTLAGAALDLSALKRCGILAGALVILRLAGIFIATWMAGKIGGDPPVFRKNAWMAYVTQAGVAIGLARLAENRFPDIGAILSTIVLAMIAVNQVLGPVTFKAALHITNEARS